ncbi:MAG: response regulator [Spirochaetaceae bacterium]
MEEEPAKRATGAPPLYSLLIVEDEEPIRNKMRANVAWEKHGIGAVYEAGDGSEALELLNSKPIDIVVTDIQMPNTGGIALVEHLKERRPETRVVVISGYAEFEYAQALLKLGVEDYILKPFRSSKLLSVVEGVCAKINEDKRESDRLERLREQVNQNRAVLRDKLFADVIMRRPNLDVVATAEYLDLSSFARGPVTVAVVELGRTPYEEIASLQEAVYMQSLDVELSLKGAVVELGMEAHVLNHRPDQLVVVVAGPLEQGNQLFEALFQRVPDQYRSEITIGVGGQCNRLDTAFVSYHEAATAAGLSYLYGAGHVYQYSDVSADDRVMDLQLDYARRVEAHLRVGAFQAIREDVGEMCDRVRDQALRRQTVRTIANNLVLSSCKVLNELGHNVDDVLGDEYTPFIEDAQFRQLSDLQRWLQGFYERVESYTSAARNDRNARLISRMKQYLEENYASNITLATLADRYGVSASYISVLFATYAETHFSEYLTELRISHAKELLRHTDMKVYEIADEVGYHDAYYFSACFKKVTGYSPSQYREA